MCLKPDEFKPGDRVIHVVRNHSWSKRSKSRIEKVKEFTGKIERITEKTAFVRIDGMSASAKPKPCVFSTLRKIA